MYNCKFGVPVLVSNILYNGLKQKSIYKAIRYLVENFNTCQLHKFEFRLYCAQCTHIMLTYKLICFIRQSIVFSYSITEIMRVAKKNHAHSSKHSIE
ncbi:unnamed protein product [Heterotrigona itama]|uniref:Uncharacterized protein n=1 Tax=Heterotrigona itama TaxID=395501 RepID=A0A6V7H656_9HYME|nr:unnamed protein product [Heterotrigona itama]